MVMFFFVRCKIVSYNVSMNIPNVFMWKKLSSSNYFHPFKITGKCQVKTTPDEAVHLFHHQ